MNIEEYEKMIPTMKLIGHLEEGEKSAREEGWFNLDEVEELLGI